VEFEMDWKEFEKLARKAMSQYFGVVLAEKNPRFSQKI
jgi:hypothetical protein